MRRLILAAAITFAVLPAMAADPAAVEKSRTAIVRVLVFSGDARKTEVSGFHIGAGRIVTVRHAVRSDDRFAVVTSIGAEVSALKIWSDEQLDLALLEAKGLVAEAIEFADGSVTSGQAVFSGAGGITALGRGSIGDVTTAGSWFRHNAMVGAEGFGAPVIDECGRAIGVNRMDPEESIVIAARADPPVGAVFAVPADTAVAAMTKGGVAPKTNATVCVPAEKVARDAASKAKSEADAARSAAEKAKAEAERMAREAEEAKQRAADAQGQAKETVAKLKQDAEARAKTAAEAGARAQTAEKIAAAAQDAAREANERANILRRQAADAAKSAKQARAKAEQTERWATIGGAAGGAVLLLLVVVIALRTRNSRIAAVAAAERIQAMEQAIAAPDPESRPGWLFIPHEATSSSHKDFYVAHSVLARNKDGIKIGRNRDVSVIALDDPTVSRLHARLLLAGDRLMIEDLKAANGTAVNGKLLTPFQPVSISGGDRITIGKMQFVVRHENE